MRKTYNAVLALFLMIALGLTSCKKEVSTTSANSKETATTAADKNLKWGSYHHGCGTPPPCSTPPASTQVCGTPTVVALIAGQHTNAGTVTVSNDSVNLKVTYTTTGGWKLEEVHLYVGDCGMIPTCGPGNPVPGRFPYSADPNRATQYTFTIPLSRLGNCFCVAAHAVVSSGGCSGTETAWGDGTRFVSQGNWGTYFSVCKQTCTQGCVIQATVLFSGESSWPNGAASVNVGGYAYPTAAMTSVLYGSQSDCRTALILIATLKICSASAFPPASVSSDANVVEAWLATLGQLSGTSQFTAPANVQAAIANVQAWENNHICP